MSENGESVIETRCRLCTDEMGIITSSFLHDTDVDHLKYRHKFKILFGDLGLEEDDTTPFRLCIHCVGNLHDTFKFRKQCLEARQFWCIQFGREQSKSLNSNYNIIPSVDNQFMRYEFVPTATSTSTTPKTLTIPKANKKELKKQIKMAESPIPTKIKKEIDDPAPLVGNMKNKLSSLLKLSPLETPKPKVESPEAASVLSLTVLRQKRICNKQKTEQIETPPKKMRTIQTEDIPKSVIKPILNINKLKENLNKRINIAAAVEIKSEPDDDDDMPLKTLKRKLSDINAAKSTTNTAPLAASPLKLNIFSLKNKLVTALKIGESLEVKQKKERRPKTHGFIVDINQIVADKKNNIYYCKYCFKYFQNVVALRYHVVQHAKMKPKTLQTQTPKTSEIKIPKKKATGKTSKTTEKITEKTTENITEKTSEKKSQQCDICEKWYINLHLHKVRSHYNKNNNKKTENHKK